ncbi:MAG: hypothetical protein ACJ747_05070 [Gaiellaceae bacterium]|nr:hypothetical protein [Acidobacteriota bacterium]
MATTTHELAERATSDGNTSQDESARAHATGWRRWVPWVLIVLAATIGLVAALNIWVKRQALNTDHWTNSSAQLLENSEIRNAISIYLVDQLYTNVDVGKALSDRLPPATKQLGPPLAAALEPALVRRANTFLGRPKVQQLWRNANRRAHELFMAVLNGKHGILESSNGNVVLNLQPLLDQLAAQSGLGAKIAEKIPPDAGKIVVMKGNGLEAARKTVKVIRVVSFFLVFLVLALFAAAVYIARGRRRSMLMAVGISMLTVGLGILVVRRFAGSYVIDALTSNPDAKDSVTATWAIGTQLLRNVGINIVVYACFAIFAAWVAGPARLAVGLRRVSAPTMRNHPLVVYGLVALVLLIVLLTGPTDADRVYPLLVVFALAFVGTTVLRRQTEREFPAATAP